MKTPTLAQARQQLANALEWQRRDRMIVARTLMEKIVSKFPKPVDDDAWNAAWVFAQIESGMDPDPSSISRLTPKQLRDPQFTKRLHEASKRSRSDRRGMVASDLNDKILRHWSSRVDGVKPLGTLSLPEGFKEFDKRYPQCATEFGYKQAVRRLRLRRASPFPGQ